MLQQDQAYTINLSTTDINPLTVNIRLWSLNICMSLDSQILFKP